MNENEKDDNTLGGIMYDGQHDDPLTVSDSSLCCLLLVYLARGGVGWGLIFSRQKANSNRHDSKFSPTMVENKKW